MIQPFFYPGLGNSAYLVVDEASGTAAVVDPQRDVDQYLAAAARAGARLTHVFETHVHNDFLSGGRQLAARHGAALVASAGAGLAFPYRAVRDGDVVPLGARLRFRVLAAPGHTPEHVAYLLEDAQGGPATLFSGGALLVGTIARTDLLGHEHAPGLARAAHDTLHRVLFALPDETRVLPTHGAGSFCASGTGGERETTIGVEKRRNRFAGLVEPAAFICAALSGLPRYPRYFTWMRALNQRGPALLDGLPALPPLEPLAVARRLADGALLIDTRPPAAYVAEHVPGSFAIALEPAFSQWVGWLVPPDRPLLFVLAGDARERVARELVRIGYEELEGHLAGGVAAWRAAGLPTRSTPTVSAETLARERAAGRPVVVLDVRWDDEWAGGHLPGARHVPLPDLPERAAELPAGAPLVVHCAHSFRSGIALSLLERAGVAGPVWHLEGGFAAWQAAGLPTEADGATVER